MSNFFSKPLEAITEKDVLELQDTPEGQLFEIKETLPAEDARKRLDAWMSAPAQGQSRRGPDDYAKEGLFAELNAFANSEGGWLVLGLEETADKPSRAGAIKPLPECHELADRLQRAAHDWLDPPVPGLQFRGIEAGGGPRDGVIIARVPRSPLAPHRLNKARRTQEAYKRVGDETKPMGMREIQDMTLERALGHSRIEGAFEEARQRYGELVSDHFPQTRLIGFQIVAVPSGGPLAIDRAYRREPLFQRYAKVTGQFSQGQSFDVCVLNDKYVGVAERIRPVLRGGQRKWTRQWANPRTQRSYEDLSSLEVLDSGIISIVVKSACDDPPGLSMNWIIAEMANVLHLLALARQLAGNPDAEYLIEVDLRYDDHLDTGLVPVKDKFRFGYLEDDDEQRFRATVGKNPVRLPRYSAGSDAELPDVLNLLLRDLYNLVGREPADLHFDSSWTRIS